MIIQHEKRKRQILPEEQDLSLSHGLHIHERIHTRASTHMIKFTHRTKTHDQYQHHRMVILSTLFFWCFSMNFQVGVLGTLPCMGTQPLPSEFQALEQPRTAELLWKMWDLVSMLPYTMVRKHQHPGTFQKWSVWFYSFLTNLNLNCPL